MKIYDYSITLGHLITMSAFILILISETGNIKLEKIEEKIRISKTESTELQEILEILKKREEITNINYIGLILLFIGFMSTTMIHSIMLYHIKGKVLI